VNNLGPGMVQQGDLTDPYYFDFISFAQYKTINREITLDPPMIFEEQKGIDQGEDKPQKFVPVIIKRDPDLKNSMLGPGHNRKTGEMIINHLEEIFGGTDIAIPKISPNSRPDASEYSTPHLKLFDSAIVTTAMSQLTPFRLHSRYFARISRAARQSFPGKWVCIQRQCFDCVR
jgi:hypothetical protein